MNFNDVKLLLPASGYMKTSDDNGRTVIDEIRDASYERNHQTFAGSDRPEYDKISAIQKGVHQIAVEKESTNEILDSRDLTTANWSGTAPVTRNQVGYKNDENSANLVEDNSGTETLFKQQNVTILDDGNTHTVYALIKKDTDQSRFPEVRLAITGGATAIAQTTQINTETGAISDRTAQGTSSVEDFGDFWRLTLTLTNNSSGNTILRYTEAPAAGTTIGVLDSSATGSAIFDQAQVELNTSYPTLPIITQGTAVTRLAPSPVIQNALPETGTVAGVVKIRRDDSLSLNPIFDVVGSSSTARSILYIKESGLKSYVFGFNASTLATVTVPSSNLDLISLAYILSWNSNNIKLTVLLPNGQISFDVELHTINNTSYRSLSVVPFFRTSLRLEKPFYKDNIVRVNATDAEIKAFFEDLTRGTSMELTADQMTIAP